MMTQEVQSVIEQIHIYCDDFHPLIAVKNTPLQGESPKSSTCTTALLSSCVQRVQKRPKHYIKGLSPFENTKFRRYYGAEREKSFVFS